jgi:hypothetical protein
MYVFYRVLVPCAQVDRRYPRAVVVLHTINVFCVNSDTEDEFRLFGIYPWCCSQVRPIHHEEGTFRMPEVLELRKRNRDKSDPSFFQVDISKAAIPTGQGSLTGEQEGAGGGPGVMTGPPDRTDINTST